MIITKISCDTPYKSDASYCFRLDEVLQQHKIQIPASVLQYEMNNLDPASEYIFMVAAVNEAGESDVSNILSARTFDAGNFVKIFSFV